MRFYKVGYYKRAPINAEYPCVVLERNNWDDFGYKTLFRIYYFSREDEEQLLGEVKILHLTNQTTQEELDEEFSSLDMDFCSLGQTLEYYENIKQLGDEISTDLLTSLNDVVFNKKHLEKFEKIRGFHDSLLRFSEAEKAFNEGGKYFGEEIEKMFQFDFISQLPKALHPHIASFDFRADRHLPFRVNVIIGKNGTGKTQYLARLANALSGFKMKEQGFFGDNRRPSFSKVIAISYSAFDEFEKPSENSYSYKYCGIRKTEKVYKVSPDIYENVINQLDGETSQSLRNSITNIVDMIAKKIDVDPNKSDIYVEETIERFFTPEELKKRFISSYKNIERNGRGVVWREILEEVIEIEHRSILDNLVEDIESADMSSGQYMTIVNLTEVIDNIKDDSILLFDEPELHLHPNAILNFTRMLNFILEKFNSYAIISTHSPIILQEVPSRYINVFERQENIAMVRKLDIESFGENLGTITDKVFGTNNSESLYKDVLEKMARDPEINYQQILQKFDQKLSLNALAFLNIVYGRNGVQ